MALSLSKQENAIRWRYASPYRVKALRLLGSWLNVYRYTRIPLPSPIPLRLAWGENHWIDTQYTSPYRVVALVLLGSWLNVYKRRECVPSPEKLPKRERERERDFVYVKARG